MCTGGMDFWKGVDIKIVLFSIEGIRQYKLFDEKRKSTYIVTI